VNSAAPKPMLPNPVPSCSPALSPGRLALRSRPRTGCGAARRAACLLPSPCSQIPSLRAPKPRLRGDWPCEAARGRAVEQQALMLPSPVSGATGLRKPPEDGLSSSRHSCSPASSPGRLALRSRPGTGCGAARRAACLLPSPCSPIPSPRAPQPRPRGGQVEQHPNRTGDVE
jgi:hypothetical protein